MTNLDSIDCHAADKVSSVKSEIWVVTIQSGGFFEMEPVHL